MNTIKAVDKNVELDLLKAFGPVPERLVKVIHDTLNSLDTKGTTTKPRVDREHPVRNKRNTSRK